MSVFIASRNFRWLLACYHDTGSSYVSFDAQTISGVSYSYPRQLVDDLSLRWAGPDSACAHEVADAADEAAAALEDLMLPVQIKKLGLVASDAHTENLCVKWRKGGVYSQSDG